MYTLFAALSSGKDTFFVSNDFLADKKVALDKMAQLADRRLVDRWREHCQVLHHVHNLVKAMKKRGKKSFFIFIVSLLCPTADACWLQESGALEQVWGLAYSLQRL